LQKKPYKRDDILRKSPIIIRSLVIVKHSITSRLVQWLGWVFETQARKEERKSALFVGWPVGLVESVDQLDQPHRPLMRLLVMYGWDMWHIWMRHATHMDGSWLTHECDMTHPHVWYASFICVTWHMHTSPEAIFLESMTHSCVWCDSSICVTWLIHVCDVTHPYVWCDSFVCVTCLIHTCDMTHSYVARINES